MANDIGKQVTNSWHLERVFHHWV